MQSKRHISTRALSTFLSASVILVSTQLSGCIKKQLSEQKSLRNDSGDLLYENLAISDPELLVKAFSNNTDIVSYLPICYFKSYGSNSSGNIDAKVLPAKNASQYPILFGDALSLMASRGVQFDKNAIIAELNKEFFALLNNPQTATSEMQGQSLQMDSADLALNSPEMALVPLAVARIFIGSKLLGWGTVSRILGALKFAAKPAKGQIIAKTPALANLMTTSLAKISKATLSTQKKSKALARLSNMKNLRAFHANLAKQKGLGKLFQSVTKMATSSVMWLPFFAGDIFTVVKNSGVAGKNPTEDQVIKQLELFTPEQLESFTTQAATNTEARFTNSPNLNTQLDKTATAMNDALARFEIKTSDDLFAQVEAEILRIGAETKVSSVECLPPEDSLVEDSSSETQIP